MKKMRKSLQLLAFMLCFSYLSAQVKFNGIINENSLGNNSAFIDGSSSDTWNSTANIGKGITFPRTDLTTFSSFSMIGTILPYNNPNAFDGFLVFNVGTGVAAIGGGMVNPGFYYYRNTSGNIAGGTWVSMASSSSSDDQNIENLGIDATTNTLTVGIEDGNSQSVDLSGIVKEPWFGVDDNAAATLNTEDMYVMGRVGIGTDSPNTELHVQDDDDLSKVMISRSDGNKLASSTFGTPYLSIGNREYSLDTDNNTDDYLYSIGFGYHSVTNTLIGSIGPTGEFGLMQTNSTSNTTGDFVFALRNSTSDTYPTERLRIKQNGLINSDYLENNYSEGIFSTTPFVSKSVVSSSSGDLISSSFSTHIGGFDVNSTYTSYDLDYQYGAYFYIDAKSQCNNNGFIHVLYTPYGGGFTLIREIGAFNGIATSGNGTVSNPHVVVLDIPFCSGASITIKADPTTKEFLIKKGGPLSVTIKSLRVESW